MLCILFLKKWSLFPHEVRLIYRYGETSVPNDVKSAVVRMVAIDVLSADDRSVLLPEGSAQLKYIDKITLWEKQINRIISKYREFDIALD